METEVNNGRSDVLSALELVKDEVDKESKRIMSAGGEALKDGKIQFAKETIAYAEKLAEFAKKIESLGDDWSSLQKEIDLCSPDVQEIVQPVLVRQPKTGYHRIVDTVSPKTNFTVAFPDGQIVADSKASVVFAKTIEKLGAARVALLGLFNGGEPLATRNRSLYVKYPSAVMPISDGWFVKTHSNTHSKMTTLQKIAGLLGVEIKCIPSK